MASTSNVLQNDTKSLTEQLRNVSVDLVPRTVTNFTASHRKQFKRLSQQLDSLFAMQCEVRATSGEGQVAAARQGIFDSLYFAQIHERRDRIHRAHNSTYRWILDPTPADPRR